ncbi:aldehyde dehydrogenase family protein [Fusibacter ferrireducens]|uniref:aldehyde dehydrogenase family protein n=1 Tax=Fusibacter ferrireducens TaxID=2785058 RepID=UPI002B498F1F|nr:aldehyde dehydrogenase family protein [Fusibacter ferrireducens]
MNIQQSQIDIIAKIVAERLKSQDEVALSKGISSKSISTEGISKETVSSEGIFEDMDTAIEAAYQAQRTLFEKSLEFRKKITNAIKAELMLHVEELAMLAVKESGMGNVKDKIIKNTVAIEKTPSVEDLMSGVFTGDDGLTLLEYSPFGVIGAIAPSTNPSETVICNSIGMIAAGNAVVFCPHPGSYKTSNLAIKYINKAIKSVGGPANLVVTMLKPSMAAVETMMHHPLINMLCATGGPSVVKAVLESGKKAIGAGAGNPPVLVDETADIEKAARDIINGCSFDNNLPCIAEKEAIVVDEICDYLIFNMKQNGAYELTDKVLIQKLETLVFKSEGVLNREFVGKDAKYILDKIDISVGDEIKAIIMEADKDHPFVVEELMMPILPIVRVKDASEGIDLACKLEHGLRHTAMCHSKNIDVLTEMAHRIQTTIFVKNGPSYAGIGVGGEGFTTFTIAGPTGEGLTSAKSFTRRRRCVLVGGFNIK